MKDEKIETLEEERKDRKISKRFTIYIMAILVTVLLGGSFAAFSYDPEKDENNIMQTGTLILDLKEEDDLTLINSAPTSDADGERGKAYEFTVENTGTENAKYRIYLVEDTEKYQEDNCSDKKMPWNELRYSLEKNNEKKDSANLPEDGIMMSSIINSGETDNYKLRMWIKSSAGNEVAGLHFHAKLKIKAILEDKTDYDTGA